MVQGLAEKSREAAQRFVLHGIDWRGYRSLLQILGERPLRVTYDRGMLELKTPLPIHDRYKSLLGRFIELVTEELNLDIFAFGSTTLARESLDCGLEPDECFAIASAGRIREPEQLDLEIDPPPDLAIETDVTSNSSRKQDVHAALGIPEFWHFDGEILTVLRHQADGGYRSMEQSVELPFITAAEIAAFLRGHRPGTDTQWARSVRKWIRETVLPRTRADDHEARSQ